MNEMWGNLDISAKVGIHLKKKVYNRAPLAEIGAWAREVFEAYMGEMDSDTEALMIILGDLAGKVHLDYDQLDETADDLILGLDLDLEPYYDAMKAGS